jgi:SAM-dependent methyltransferase
LFKTANRLFTADDYLDAEVVQEKHSVFKKLLPSISVNLSVTKILPRLTRELDTRGRSVILVVGGGTQRSWLNPLLSSQHAHKIIYCDVDKWADVDLFCDAHDLPIQDGSIDAVVTTAVLEHVMYPETVAKEIGRVLKDRGLLYSELPFMQQVHEGAYDFTRYTMSGHRRLFNQFQPLETGLVSGPATGLHWSIENFFLSWTSSQIIRLAIKSISRLSLFWLKYIDYFLARKPAAFDGACCTFFYGEKSSTRVNDSQIIEQYVGTKTTTHT